LESLLVAGPTNEKLYRGYSKKVRVTEAKTVVACSAVRLVFRRVLWLTQKGCWLCTHRGMLFGGIFGLNRRDVWLMYRRDVWLVYV
jgi:hypothetical protein